MAYHARAAGRDKTDTDERTAGHRCRQHLRQRGAVSRAYPSAARVAAPDAQGVRAPGALGTHDAAGGDSRRWHDTAQLREHRGQPWRFSPEALCLYARRAPLPRLRHADSTDHAGPALELFLSAVPALSAAAPV